MMDKKKLDALKAQIQSNNEQWLAGTWDAIKAMFKDEPRKAEQTRLAIMREISHGPFADQGAVGWFVSMRATMVQIGMAALQEKILEWEAAGEIQLLGDGTGVHRFGEEPK